MKNNRKQKKLFSLIDYILQSTLPTNDWFSLIISQSVVTYLFSTLSNHPLYLSEDFNLVFWWRSLAVSITAGWKSDLIHDVLGNIWNYYFWHFVSCMILVWLNKTGILSDRKDSELVNHKFEKNVHFDQNQAYRGLHHIVTYSI